MLALSGKELPNDLPYLSLPIARSLCHLGVEPAGHTSDDYSDWASNPLLIDYSTDKK